jgi:predicted dehydrogenase
MTKNDKTSLSAQSTSPTPGPSLSQITSTLSFDPASSDAVVSDTSVPPVSDDALFLEAPPKQHFAKPPQILVIGAGSRGTSYARSALSSSNAIIAAVCEPIESKRLTFGNTFIWGDIGVPRFGACFSDWREWVCYEKERRESLRTGKGLTGDGGFAPIVIDVVFVCVLDEMHEEVVCGIAELGVHICVEKPLSTSLQSCGRIYRALKSAGESRGGSEDAGCEEGLRKETVFGICHVLRYSPHNMMLRHLVLDQGVIGDVLSIEHVEPVGWWHFSHSYVR